MIDNEIVTEAIEYILHHVWDNVTLEDVANHCHISVSRLSVIFGEQTGESVYAFIKREKMEQSAQKIKLELSKSITEIGADYGYSASNYSSAFSLYHKKAPSSFRSETIIDASKNREVIDRIQSQIRIEQRPDYIVAYERFIGNYEQLQVDWCNFKEKYRDEINEHTIFFERTFDNPSITEKEHCIYDICMTTEHPEKYKNSCILHGGRFVVFPFKGFIREIYVIHQELVEIWFPVSGYELDERYAYDQYNIVREDGYMEFDICIPVK